MSSQRIRTVFTRIVVPNLSGNKDWFCGRVFPWIVGGVDVFRVIQVHHICCVLYYYYNSSTSDHQALVQRLETSALGHWWFSF